MLWRECTVFLEEMPCHVVVTTADSGAITAGLYLNPSSTCSSCMTLAKGTALGLRVFSINKPRIRKVPVFVRLL